MKRLTIILGMLGMFALGCAAASVLIDTAEATPPSGSQQCAVFETVFVTKKDIEKNRHEEMGTWLPAGWTAVAAAGVSVLACRTAP